MCALHILKRWLCVHFQEEVFHQVQWGRSHRASWVPHSLVYPQVCLSLSPLSSSTKTIKALCNPVPTYFPSLLWFFLLTGRPDCNHTSLLSLSKGVISSLPSTLLPMHDICLGNLLSSLSPQDCSSCQILAVYLKTWLSSAILRDPCGQNYVSMPALVLIVSCPWEVFW